MAAMEEKLGGLEEKIGTLMEAIDGNHAFGERGAPNPMNGDNGEWEGAHTRAYFRK